MNRRLAICVTLLPLLGAAIQLGSHATIESRKSAAEQKAMAEMPGMSEIPDTFATSETSDNNIWACWAARNFVEQTIDGIATQAQTKATISFGPPLRALQTNGQWRVQGEVNVLVKNHPGDPIKLRWEAILTSYPANPKSPIRDNDKMITFFKRRLANPTATARQLRPEAKR